MSGHPDRGVVGGLGGPTGRVESRPIADRIWRGDFEAGVLKVKPLGRLPDLTLNTVVIPADTIQVNAIAIDPAEVRRIPESID